MYCLVAVPLCCSCFMFHHLEDVRIWTRESMLIHPPAVMLQAGERRSRQQREGGSGGRPLRAARIASAEKGGPARGDGALTGTRIAVYWREDAAYYKVGVVGLLDCYMPLSFGIKTACLPKPVPQPDGARVVVARYQRGNWLYILG